MAHLNGDVLLLIFGELKNDKKSLYSCLLVNRTWCVTAVPILWKNPSQFCKCYKSKKILYNVILSHLSEESRDILKTQGMNNLIKKTYQHPLFNYISFWKYLELHLLENITSSKNIEKSNFPIIRKEILKLFINKNTKFIHLSIPTIFDYQLHLIPGAECCISELESLQCDSDITHNIIEGLTGICKSIKKITLHSFGNINPDYCGIFKLIEIQKNLNEFYLFNNSMFVNESFDRSLENSLIKHANTIQYLKVNWIFSTRFLSYFVNLLSLEIGMPQFAPNENLSNFNDPNYLKNFSLPNLKILKVYYYPLNVIANLIGNTARNLSEISIHCDGDLYYNWSGSYRFSNRNFEDTDSCKLLIQTIYQNCPNIKYLKLSLEGSLLISKFENLLGSEFENLLINCKFLNGLIISLYEGDEFDWNKLFQILAKSSPTFLFKFKFYSITFELKDIESFFASWKNRKPILLKISSELKVDEKLMNLVNQYKAKGVIKKYSFGIGENIYEDFEWI